ncbi:MAG: inorganic phosphate transporter [Deltaproteobacteria bacterium]|nr:inorganic phosphate transporter [Deltaproteobacteria bacterium]
MIEVSAIFLVVIALALLFDFMNGWNDAASNIATVISTRALSPLAAVCLAALLNFAGAYLSTRVARTVSADLVDATRVTAPMLLAALTVATAWVAGTALAGISVSSTHALIGSLLGAVIAGAGGTALRGDVLLTLIALVGAPLVALGAGFVLMGLFLVAFRSLPPRELGIVFGKLQLLSASALALAHGTTDAQKIMGVIVIALVATGSAHPTEVPFWVMSLAAVMIGVGAMVGGWRAIHGRGTVLMRIRSVQAFASEAAASGVLFGAAALGLPISATQVTAGSVVGVSATKSTSALRHGVNVGALYVSAVTLPTCAVAAALLAVIIS